MLLKIRKNTELNLKQIKKGALKKKRLLKTTETKKLFALSKNVKAFVGQLVCHFLAEN